jgi:hypothetical protein
MTSNLIIVGVCISGPILMVLVFVLLGTGVSGGVESMHRRPRQPMSSLETFIIMLIAFAMLIGGFALWAVTR